MIDTYESLFWGYCFIWGMMVLYLVRLALKIRALEKQAKNNHE